MACGTDCFTGNSCYASAMKELTLAVVGIDFANANGGNRRFELMLCEPGEAIALRLEPRNRHDPSAVSVWSARGIQIGYLSSERCGWIGGRIRAGETYVVVFQGMADRAAHIRIRFGGGVPMLPASSAHTGSDVERGAAGHEDGFYPDADGPEWGA